MQITKHAVERFLQGVMKKSHYDRSEFMQAYEFLKKSFMHVVTHRDFVPIPQIKGYVAIVKDNVVVTVIEKNASWKKAMKYRNGYRRYSVAYSA